MSENACRVLQQLGGFRSLSLDRNRHRRASHSHAIAFEATRRIDCRFDLAFQTFLLFSGLESVPFLHDCLTIHSKCSKARPELSRWNLYFRACDFHATFSLDLEEGNFECRGTVVLRYRPRLRRYLLLKTMLTAFLMGPVPSYAMLTFRHSHTSHQSG